MIYKHLFANFDFLNKIVETNEASSFDRSDLL